MINGIVKKSLAFTGGQMTYSFSMGEWNSICTRDGKHMQVQLYVLQHWVSCLMAGYIS
jgi:hypothetical protein